LVTESVRAQFVRGKSNKAIARELQLACNTVRDIVRGSGRSRVRAALTVSTNCCFGSTWKPPRLSSAC